MTENNPSLEPDVLESLMAAWDAGHVALLNWWRERLTADIFDRAKFPVQIATRHGPSGLVDAPPVIVGTIHSVKGGQADVVYLFPDLSQAADSQYQSDSPGRDTVTRVFYVGLTRAREALCICGRESPAAQEGDGGVTWLQSGVQAQALSNR